MLKNDKQMSNKLCFAVTTFYESDISLLKVTSCMTLGYYSAKEWNTNPWQYVEMSR